MVFKYLTHIYEHLMHISCTVVVQSITVQLMYNYRRCSVQGLEVGRRCHGGKDEIRLRAIGGKVE